jgi:peptidoglycan/LPS O-acetylase OafA/YrhL
MSQRATIAYQPALDGVRALAVAAVLLFHAEVAGFDGGYLGVSVFFTLSGYLITSLLVHEHDRRGTIRLGAFYARRVRRLLPASALCLGLIIAIATVTDVFAGVADLRRQIVGSILQVANWVFLAGEGSYQEIFQQTGGTRSPLEHFWSLAIEEQFYWVWPPTMLFVLGRVRGRRARTAVIAAIAATFSVASPVIAFVWGADAAYWATPARIAEILLGAVLAVALAGRGGRDEPVVPATLAWLAPIALAALAACVVLFPASSGPAYEGWLPLVAVGSAALVLGLQAPGPVRTALSVRPAVWLGRISYGVYLYHWPIYVILDADRTGLSRPLLVPLQLATTLVVAQLSYVLVEHPIRRVRRVAIPLTFGTGVLATAAVAVLALTIVPKPLGEYWEADHSAIAGAAIETGGELAPLTSATVATGTLSTTAPETTAPDTTAPDTTAPEATTPESSATESTSTPSTTAAPPTTTEPPLPALARPARIVVAGDSTAQATGAGLIYWANDNPDIAQVDVLSAPGCGFLLGGERREGGFRPLPEACQIYVDDDLPGRVAELQPDVVMLMVTTWDLVDRRFEDGVERTPLDPEFEMRLQAGYEQITDELLALGAGSVAWVRPPIPNILWRDNTTGQEDPARHDVLTEVLDAVAAARPGEVAVVDLRGWLDDSGRATDRDVRPDGVHFEPVAAVSIASDWLGERLVRIAVGA